MKKYPRVTEDMAPQNSMTCDRCGKTIFGQELERAEQWCSTLTFCDECQAWNDAWLADVGESAHAKRYRLR
jgi:acetyl-CoA carboxylase beta subunit